MKTEYTFRNGTIVKCEYIDGDLRIDEDIAFRTVTNENGEKERVIAIDLNTGLTTNKYINEHSKKKMTTAQLNKLRKEEGLAPIKVERKPTKASLQKKLDKLLATKSQRDELKKAYDKAGDEVSKIFSKIQSLSKYGKGSWMKEAEKALTNARKEENKAHDKIKAFDKKHPTLIKDIDDIKKQIQEIEQAEYEKKHPKLDKAYLDKVGATKFNKEAVARAGEIVAKTIQDEFAKITAKYEKGLSGWFYDAYDKKNVLVSAKKALEKHNAEMQGLLGSKYNAKSVIDNIDKAIANTNEVIAAIDDLRYDVYERISDSFWESGEGDEDDLYDLKQQANYKLLKNCKLNTSDINALKQGKWETMQPMTQNQRDYYVSHSW